MRDGSVAAALADLVLPDADGKPVRLGALWQTAPAVGHYG